MTNVDKANHLPPLIAAHSAFFFSFDQDVIPEQIITSFSLVPLSSLLSLSTPLSKCDLQEVTPKPKVPYNLFVLGESQVEKYLPHVNFDLTYAKELISTRVIYGNKLI